MRLNLPFTLFLICLSTTVFPGNIYVNSDANIVGSGNSASSPFKSLHQIPAQIDNVDTIFLAGNKIYPGAIVLKDLDGVVVTSYDNGRATIDCAGYFCGILIEDCRNITVKSLNITGNGCKEDVEDKATAEKMRCGVVARTTSKGDFGNITLEDIYIKDIFYFNPGYERGKNEIKTANGTQAYGWGIRFFNKLPDASLKTIYVRKCYVENVAHTGIIFSGKIQNITVEENSVYRSGGPGMQMSSVEGVLIRRNTIDRSGANDDTRKWGRGSGYWCWGARDIVFEHNRITNANGPGDSAGAHIDYNCSNVIYQYNFSANNAGGFCEVLGNNYNCCYRYNISVNDGWREKGKNGAFQEGKVLWTSGYVGDRQKPSGPYNTYIYNNTIYLSPGKEARVAIGSSTVGALIANNIFCFANSSSVLGDQNNPERKSENQAQNIVFKNNLYLHNSTWDRSIPIEDSNPMIGDPMFKNPAGMALTDYIPTNKKAVAKKGAEIALIPNDTVGLITGLDVQHDILGNKIKGKKSLGAIIR